MTVEKRGRERIDFSITVVLETPDNRTYLYDCKNVSMSGFFLHTESPLPIGTACVFTLTMESGAEQLLVKGESTVVRHVIADPAEGHGMGIHISSMDPDSSINLYNIIKYQQIFDDY